MDYFGQDLFDVVMGFEIGGFNGFEVFFCGLFCFFDWFVLDVDFMGCVNLMCWQIILMVYCLGEFVLCVIDLGDGQIMLMI